MEKYIAARTGPHVQRGKTHFPKQVIIEVTYLAATINAWNRLAIARRAVPGHYRATTTIA
jgi:alkylhydroperoxidase family enzyme